MILGLLALSSAFGKPSSRGTTELAVTDQRVIYKTGLLARHTLEMNRARVESVTVDQTMLGRLFGYGTVIVRGRRQRLGADPQYQRPADLPQLHH